MSDPRNNWKDALQPGSDCVAIERLGETLTPRENEHVAHCTRCQTELELLREFLDGETEAHERAAVAAIAGQLKQGFDATPSNVVSLAQRRGSSRTRMLAAAAMLIIAIGIGYVAVNREPSANVPLTTTDVYRSSRITVIAPGSEEVTAPPAELQWATVQGATGYDVQIFEVDRTLLWHTTTQETRVTLPPQIVGAFVPGKTILWEVKALRGAFTAADSGVQKVRVAVK